MTKFQIMENRCDQCLYSPNKIVSDARRKELLREIERKDTHFICHKASIAGLEIACRGDWDARGCGQLGRIMGRLNGLEFVPDPSKAPCRIPETGAIMPGDEFARERSSQNMAKTNGVSPDMNAVAKGQRTALELWSPDPAKRMKQLEAYRASLQAEKDAIAAAKEAAKAKSDPELLKEGLIKKNGWNKTALACVTKIAGITDVEERSRAARQVYEACKDSGFLVPELFDEAGIGVGSADDADTGGFDATTEGRRRGGKKAQPPAQQRTPEEMAASNKPREIPQGPKTYDEIVAAFTKEEDAWKANGAKPGRKPKAYVEAKEALDQANADREAGAVGSETADEEASAADAAPPEPPAPPSETSNVVQLPTAKAGEVSDQIKEGTKAGDAALAASIEASKKNGASNKPKTSRKPKADAAPPPPPAPEPEAQEDEEDEGDADIPTGGPPMPPERIGNRANTGRMA